MGNDETRFRESRDNILRINMRKENTHRKYTRVWRITKARREDNKT